MAEGGSGGDGDISDEDGVPYGEIGRGFEVEIGAVDSGVGAAHGPGDVSAGVNGGKHGEGGAGLTHEVFDAVGNEVGVVVSGEGSAGGVLIGPGGVSDWAGGDGEGAGAGNERGFVLSTTAGGSVDAGGLLSAINEELVNGVGADEGEVEGAAGGEAVGGGFIGGVNLGYF